MTHSSQPPSSILAALLVVVGACATGSEGPSAADAALPAGHPPLSAVDKESDGPLTEAGPASEPANSLEGTVKETMNGGGYT